VELANKHPEVFQQFAESLGLTIESLQRLKVGMQGYQHRVWTFPMRDGDGQITGIRLRLQSGRKLSVKGSKSGLFIPDGLSGGRLVICEGPTDTAALLDLGFDAVGRPSCSGGVTHLRKLLQRLRPSSVVVVADSDPQGQNGAEKLAMDLLAYSPIVKVIVPPNGTKDARAWKNAGDTSADVEAAIDAAAVRSLAI
jgi:5S rRNA maturation endonuclease (ribonuclease M5)